MTGESGGFLPHQSLWWGSNSRTFFSVSKTPSEQTIRDVQRQVDALARRFQIEAGSGPAPWLSSRFTAASDCGGRLMVIGRDFQVPASADQAVDLVLALSGRTRDGQTEEALGRARAELETFERNRRESLANICTLLEARDRRLSTATEVADFIGLDGQVYVLPRNPGGPVAALLERWDVVWRRAANELRRELN